MLRVRVCAAHMGGFLGPKFSRQGSLFRQIFHKHGWVFQKLAKNSQKWVVFRQNSSVIRRGYLPENRAADPRPSASHVPPRDFDINLTFHIFAYLYLCRFLSSLILSGGLKNFWDHWCHGPLFFPPLDFPLVRLVAKRTERMNVDWG